MFYNFNGELKLRQECYGHYCNKCRQKELTPIKFNKFTIEFWNVFRKIK